VRTRIEPGEQAKAARAALRALLLLVGMVGWLAQGTQGQIRFRSEYMQDREIVEVPFEYVNHQIVVKGEADTKKDLTLLFDTGASAPVFDKSLGLTSYHIADSVIHEAEGASKGETVWIDNLRLPGKEGGVKVHNIAVLLTDLSQVSRIIGRKVDGVIGLSFMLGYVIEADYEKRLLRFFSPRTVSVAQRRPDNQRTFLLDLIRPAGKRESLQVRVTGKLHLKYDYDFLLDTGFGGYVSVAQSAAQEAGLLKANTPRIPIISYSASRQFRSYKIRAPFLMIGDINLSGRIIQVDIRNNDAYGQGGILGNRFLQNYRMTLDALHSKLWLERVTTREEPDDAEKPSLGLSIRTNGRATTIERVARFSPADFSGVRPGDVLIAINGIAIQGMPTAQIANMLASPRGATVLALSRGANPQDGTGGDYYNLTLQPSSPLDWEQPRGAR